jgi:CDP-glucose 4,6-dehydratase
VYQGRRVLVTGHTGFKGSWLAQWLLRLGAEVAGFSLYVPSKPSHFEALDLGRSVQHFVGDIRDFESLADVLSRFRPEFVFHLAAQPIVTVSYEQPKLTFDTNVGGMVNILEAIRSSKNLRAAVLITSDKCYENVEWEYGYREIDRLGGKDPYSASKACAELVFSSYARTFFAERATCRLATVRAGNVIGGGDWAKDRLIPDLVRSWSSGQSAPIRSPEATRPWQHVLEPLSGYLWLGSRLADGRGNLSGEPFNFGPDGRYDRSVRSVIDEMRKHWPEGSWHSENPSDAAKPEAKLLKLNCDRAYRRLGWIPTLTFEETIARTAQWYRRYYEGKGDVSSMTDEQISSYEGIASERKLVWA